MKIQKRYKITIFLIKLGAVINAIYGIFLGFSCLLMAFINIFTDPVSSLVMFLLGVLFSAFFIVSGYYVYKVSDYALKFLQIAAYNNLDKDKDFALNPIKVTQ